MLTLTLVLFRHSNTINTFVKKIFCPYCDLFQNQVHQCSVKACFINIDKNNKVFIESDSEKGALRLSEDENDHMSCNVIKSYKSIMEMNILFRDQSDTWKLQIRNERKEKHFHLMRLNSASWIMKERDGKFLNEI